MYTRKEIFSIPNIIGYVRILLIPVFMYFYISADTLSYYYTASAIVLVSTFSDLFDGMIARKFNMVTELGKLIDPLADKLSHGAMMICLLTRYQAVWLLLGIFVLKEGFMAIMGLVMLRHYGRKLDGAKWFGKVCTAVLFLTMFALFLIPEMSTVYVNYLIWLCAAVMLITLILYIPVFVKMYKEP